VAALLAASSVASVAGCGSSVPPVALTAEAQPFTGAPVPLEVADPFFVAGESMYWELSLHGVVGGEAVISVGNPGLMDDRRAIVVRSRVQSSGVARLIKKINDDVTTWIDLGSSLPIHISSKLEFGHRATEIETHFRENRTGFDYQYQRRGKPLRVLAQRIPVAVPVHDAHSVLGVLRAWEPCDGTRAYFYVVGGRRVWHNTIVFTGREAIRTAMGTFPAIRIDGVATRLNRRLAVDTRKKPRAYSVWFSDDANRVPLRMTAQTEYGPVRAELVDYERPELTVARR
jgi:hypothetical protein